MKIIPRVWMKIHGSHTEGLDEHTWKSHSDINHTQGLYDDSWKSLRVLMTIHGNNTDSAITRACQASDFGMLTFLSKNLEYICMSSSQFSSFFSNTGLGGSSSVKAEMDKLVKHNKS